MAVLTMLFRISSVVRMRCGFERSFFSRVATRKPARSWASSLMWSRESRATSLAAEMAEMTSSPTSASTGISTAVLDHRRALLLEPQVHRHDCDKDSKHFAQAGRVELVGPAAAEIASANEGCGHHN